MNSNKFIMGGIVGGAVYLILGYVIFGLILKNFFDSNVTPTDMSKIIWWALIVANLFAGFLLSYIIGKAKAATMGAGAGTGFVLGLFMTLSVDLLLYSMNNNVMNNLKVVAVDALATAVMSAIAGAVIGWVYGLEKKPAA